MKNQRFDRLMDRYRRDELSYEEYQEFLELLTMQGTEQNLDKILTRYWHLSERTASVDRSVNRKIKEKPGLRDGVKWAIAASVVVAIGLSVFLWMGSPWIDASYTYYKTGFGERMDIELDDGSRVTLNANSELKWTAGWEKMQSRQITMKGEAFFEVTNRDGIPFSVITDDVELEVLGTSFNVDNREGKTEVYLEEGKVYLKLKEKKPEREKIEEQAIVMKPGDQVRYISREGRIERTEGQSMHTAAAWKNNVLNFKNMKFGEVLDLLRDIYGQSFECTDADLLSTPMYLGVPYADWDGVRQALELSLGIRFEQKAVHRYEVQKIIK